MKLTECQRCKVIGLEKLSSHTICHGCNWSPDLSLGHKQAQGLSYYYPLNTELMKQISEIIKLVGGHVPKIA